MRLSGRNGGSSKNGGQGVERENDGLGGKVRPFVQIHHQRDPCNSYDPAFVER